MPDAEGCDSAPELDAPGFAFPFASDDDDPDPDVEGAEVLSWSMTWRSLVAWGVAKRLRDFWQNLRAEGKLPALRCFCAMARHLMASSLLLSIVAETRRKPEKVGKGRRGRNG